MDKDTTDTADWDSRILLPAGAAYQGQASATAFGSRAMFEGMRSCVVCGIDFEMGTKVTPIAPEMGLYFAHREHFVEPIPEPPGEVVRGQTCCRPFANSMGHSKECIEKNDKALKEICICGDD